MRKLLLVTRHEFRLATASRTYLMLTVLGPFLIFAVTVLPTLIARDPASGAGGKAVALLGGPPGTAPAVEAAFGAMGITVEEARDEAGAKADALAGETAGFLAIDPGWPAAGRAVWYTRTGTDAALFGAASSILGAIAREERIKSSGIDPAVLARILAEPRFEVVKLESGGGESSAGEGEFLRVLLTALAVVMTLYMTIMLYGQMIGRSVVTEKTSKTVETMLSSVTSGELMSGKILGLGLAGLLQYAVWVSMALLLVGVAGKAFGIAPPAGLGADTLAWLVTYFILAYFLYASAFAALGAAAEDEHQLGQLAWPLLLFLIAPFVLITAFIMNPDSPPAVVLSIFPMTSPIVMMARILVSRPPAWQLAASLLLLAAAIGGMALLAAKVFRVGILMTGKRVRPGEILRWLRVR